MLCFPKQIYEKENILIWFIDREFEPRKKELPMTTGSAFQQGRPSTHRSNRDREDQFLMQRSAKSEGSTRPTSILFGVEKRGADGKIIGPPDLPDDEDLVRHLCSRFGEIRSIRKFGDNWMIVTFYDTKPVDMAFRELNGKPWKGAEGIIRVKSRIKHGNNLGGSGGAKEYNSRGDFSSRGSYNVHSEYRKQHRHPIGPTCSIWVAYEAVQKTEDGGHTEALEEDELVQLFSKFGEVMIISYTALSAFAITQSCVLDTLNKMRRQKVVLVRQFRCRGVCRSGV